MRHPPSADMAVLGHRPPLGRIFDLFHSGAGLGAKGLGVNELAAKGLATKGLGLGLYLVKSFVELHRGVWVRSAPGEGATFAFALPWGTQAPGLDVTSRAA